MAQEKSRRLQMKLYIDTSDNKKIVLRLNEEEFVEVSENRKSQRLLLFLSEILEKNNISIKDFDQIEVNTGPGSFTGLRVGISVSQALGYSLGIPVNGKDVLKENIDIKY